MLRPIRPTRPAARLLVMASTALLVSACSGSSYDGVDLDGLDEGPCTPVVGTLEEVDADLRGLADEELTPEQAGKRFASVQDDLADARVGAEVEPAVTDLITALGFFRVSVDSLTYDGDDAGRVRTSLGALADACRTS